MKNAFPDLHYEISELHHPVFAEKKVRLQIARLDQIHPVISGNKLFKLYYFLEQAVHQTYSSLLTFGGAYSNHLVATAYAAQLLGMPSIGIVRGEKPATLSPTLVNCISYGMSLQFISRSAYQDKETDDFLQIICNNYPGALIIPEGGYHPMGATGAAQIMNQLPKETTHICTAVGTATTLAGLIQAATKEQSVIGIPVIKQLTDIHTRLDYLLDNNNYPYPVIFDQYHGGGYAKTSPTLFAFMNDFYSQQQIPTDFVYTAKMMEAITDQINKGYFAEGSHIVCLHTGGLQGNASLPAGTLVF